MNKKTLRDYEYRGKRTLVRVDFNVPTDSEGNITDDTRITAALPTINYLVNAGARVIAMTHFGRPKNGPDPKYTLDKIALRFSERLGRPVKKLDKVVGPEVEAAVRAMKDGDVVLLENVRFEPGETKDDPALTQKMAALGELYVNDAFGSSHRAHCSTHGVALALPSAAGFLLEKEIEALGAVAEAPEKPFTAMIGGAKVSSKIGVIKHLMNLADTIVIGGGMAFTFLKAQGLPIGNSLCEDEFLKVAKETLDDAARRGVKFILPLDVVIADAFENGANRKVVDAKSIPDGWIGMDIGPATLVEIEANLDKAAMVVWNGPMGVFEMENFSQGTFAVARKLASVKAKAIIGGGDSVAAINQAGVADSIYHISTGGGASLEMLEGQELPGIAALPNR